MRRPPHRESVRADGARCLDTQYGRSLEPVPEAIEARGESKSAVSRRFVRHGEKMLSERLAARLDGFAWKAQHRLHSRYARLMGRGKTKQQAMTAVARELAGFVWAVGVEVERQLASRPARAA